VLVRVWTGKKCYGGGVSWGGGLALGHSVYVCIRSVLLCYYDYEYIYN